MALATLSVNLEIGLSKFEADAGRASQIVTRGAEQMAGATAKADAGVRRYAESFGRVGVENKVIQAAVAGASDDAIKLFAGVERGAAAFGKVGARGTAAFAAIGQTADKSLASAEARVLAIAEKARQVRDQAGALTTTAVAENKAGTLSDDGLKTRLANIRAVQAAELKRIAEVARAEGDAERAAQALAAKDAADAAGRQAAARKLIDSQNGLTASYREQLQALRELRDAGNITPAQFKKAGAELVAQQPVVRAEASRQQAAQAFLNRVNDSAGSIKADGTLKSQSELLAQQAALLGVSKQAEAAIAKIALLDARNGQLGRSAGIAANQLRTLQFTVSDIVASAGSGISPLTILLQQGPQLAQVEGGIGGIFRTAVSLVTPFRVAMGAAVTAIGAVGAAWLDGSKQSKAFNDALLLSGNFAGQTEGQFNALVSNVSAGGKVTAGAAREIAQALLATGQIGPEVFAQATQAGALLAQATGKTADEVARSFATMSQGVSKWADDYNKSSNFITAAQLQVIRGLENSGKATEAQGLVFDALAKQTGGLADNLTVLDRALRVVTTTWGRFWEAASGVGRAETAEDRLARAQQAVAQARLQAGEPASIGPYAGPRPSGAARLAGALEAQRFAERAVDIGNESAAATSATAKLNREAAAADTFVAGFDKRVNAVKALSRAVDDAVAKFAAQDKLAAQDPGYRESEGYKASVQRRPAILAEIRKEFAPRADRGAEKDASNERKAALAKELQVYADALARERDVLRFNQDEQRAIYLAGNVSLAKFYDDREAIIRRGTQAELNEQANAIGRIAAELKRGDLKADERLGLDKQLADAQAKAVKIQRDADNAATLSTYERAAAIRSLTREVEDFAATLAELQGDPLGAAQVRASQQIEAARTLAARATPAGNNTGDFARADRGQSPIDLDAYERAIKVNNDFTEVRRRAGVATADATRAEELYLLRAKQTGASLVEQDRAVYTLRSVALVQLGELTEAARKLADASTDPRVKAYAADLSLQYAQAAQAVDPALSRLKASGDELGSSLAGIFGDAINKGTTFLDLVNNIGATVQASITKSLITEPLEAALKVQISSFIDGDNPLAGILRGSVGVGGGAVAAGQAAAAQAATLNISQLALAAGQATFALRSIGAGPGVSSPASGGGFLSSLFSGIGNLFGGGGGLLPGGVGAVPYHTGGLVGQGGPARAVSVATFDGAQRYHVGGIIAGGGAAGLAANEVPAILMGGPKGRREEVLTATDPRHRDNLGGQLLRLVAARGGARLQANPNASTAVRYHTGGIAGLAPDGAPMLMRDTPPAGAAAERSGRRGGGSVQNINITMPPGTSRETADQIASRMAQRIGAASRRNN